MRLADFFRAIEPMLAERASAAEVAGVLYGRDPGRDGERLAFYQSMCRWRRAETLAGIFPRVHRHIADEARWRRLTTAYFAEAPWTDIKQLASAAGFPAFLARALDAGEALPAWLPELADLEWWVLATRVAADPADDPARGPLRLASTLEIRRYRFDLAGWVDDLDGEAPAPPVAGRFAVLFWRDRDLVACVRSAPMRELQLLAAVRSGAAALDIELAAGLHRIGVLVGAGLW